VLADVAVAAEDLRGVVGDFLAHLGGDELDAVRVEAVARLPPGHLSGGVVDVRPRRLPRGETPGDEARDLAEVSGRPAARLPLARVPGHDLDAAAADPERHGGEADALDLEVAHHVDRRVALGPEAILDRDLGLLEDELGRRRGAHAGLVLDLLAEREAL